jgi:DHA2 family multidrug resistance protein
MGAAAITNPQVITSRPISTGQVAPAWTPARSAAGDRSPFLIALIVAIPVFMEVLDTAIANVSLRHIAGSLAAGTDESTWVITSYLVANAAILPISAWLSEVIGRKRFFTISVIIFTLASFLCGTATSLPMLIFYRVLQGLGGGSMQPVSQAILADSFPPAKRPQAFALWGMAVIVSPVLGPPIGGWITETYSWPWIFWINVPVGIVSVLLCQALLHEPQLLVDNRRRRWAEGIRLDFIGFALAALGLACLEVTLSKGEQKDWFASPMVRTFGIVSLSSLVLMVVWECFRRDPVVDVGLFSVRSFAACFFVMFAAGVCVYASVTLLPMLLQTVHGYTAVTAGLAMSPGGMAAAVGMILVGTITHKVQLRYLVVVGLLSQVIPLYIMSGFTPDLTFWHATWLRVAQSLGNGLLFIPIVTLSYEGLAASKSNNAAVLMNIARNIGGSVGISMANTFLAWRLQYHHSVLAEQITPYNPAVNQMLTGMQSTLEAAGSGAADPQSILALDAMVNRQATVMSYNDVFLLVALMCAVVMLLIPLLPRNSQHHGEVAAH